MSHIYEKKTQYVFVEINPVHKIPTIQISFSSKTSLKYPSHTIYKLNLY
jgi:hypothetical protein